MIQFANPIWLWGLTGILIPVGIHLLSRKEGKIIYIGSLRHLQDSNTARFSTVRLNEIMLLVLRCLIIIFIVLFLSGAGFKSNSSERKWLILERGLENSGDIRNILDSLQRAGFELRYLEKKFPQVGDSLHAPILHQNYWQLMAALEQIPLQTAIVISTNRAVAFNGKRKALPENVKWITKEGSPQEYYLYAIRTSPDSAMVRTGFTESSKTHFVSKFDKILQGQLFISTADDSVRIFPADTIAIEILFDEEYAYDKLILSAALSAIRKSVPDPFSIIDRPVSEWNNSSNADWVFWLSNNPKPELVQSNVIMIEEKNQEALLEQVDRNNWILTDRLHEEVAIQKNLTLELASLLLYKEEHQTRSAQYDRRSLPEAMAWSENEDQKNNTNKNASLANDLFQQYLIFFILLTLMIERITANIRHQ